MGPITRCRWLLFIASSKKLPLIIPVFFIHCRLITAIARHAPAQCNSALTPDC
jgi:hypothetical protein